MAQAIYDRKITSRISLRGWTGHYITWVDGHAIPGWSTTIRGATLRGQAFIQAK